jgi:hypothetical protein
VAAEQGKLEQASASQQEMSAQGAEASGDAARGQQQADGGPVRGAGGQCRGQARGAAFAQLAGARLGCDRRCALGWLVAPAVRAVRRKVNQVMQSINEFIMGMINQALGLDEIEAELDGGGQDIDAPAAVASTKPMPVWKRSASRRARRKERNRQSMAQAEANIDDSRATREDALALQNDLVAHDGVLEAEEMAGQTLHRRLRGDLSAVLRHATGEGASRGGAGSRAKGRPANSGPGSSRVGRRRVRPMKQPSSPDLELAVARLLSDRLLDVPITRARGSARLRLATLLRAACAHPVFAGLADAGRWLARRGRAAGG